VEVEGGCPSPKKRHILAWAAGLIIVAAVSVTALLLVQRGNERRAKEAVAALNLMLDEAIQQADRDADSFHFELAFGYLSTVGEAMRGSTYGHAVKDRLDAAVARIQESRQGHEKKLAEGYIVFEGRLIPGPPIKLAEGEPMPTSHCVGHPGSLVIQDSTMYCRYIEIPLSESSDWEYIVWPKDPGELRVRLREKGRMNVPDVPMFLSSAPGIPKRSLPKLDLPLWDVALWVQQPYEIRDRDGKVVYRSAPQVETNAKQFSPEPHVCVSARWLQLKSFGELLKYPVIPGPRFFLGPRASISSSSLWGAEAKFGDSVAIAVIFENREASNVRLMFPKPKDVNRAAVQARALFLGSHGYGWDQLKQAPFVTDVTGEIGTEIIPRGYVEAVYLFPPSAPKGTMVLGDFGLVTPLGEELHREVVIESRDP
jgi:hypothetical protein